MRDWLRRIRGAMGMGLIWAAAWFGFGPILLAGMTLVDLLFESAVLGAYGFFGGVTFSLVLGVAERRRRFDEMSLPRFAAWGALGGLGVYVLMLLSAQWAATLGDFWSLSVPLVLLGAGSSAGSLALARRAADRELLKAGEGVAEAGLTEEERRELLQ